MWSLRERGYSIVKEQLPALVESGFRSEAMSHDLVSGALQLGEWLVGEPGGIELFSEQQLRKLHPDVYPDWVPRSQLHRPDGYTLIPIGGKNRIVAIEVEFSPKRPVDYEVIGDRYAELSSVTRVLWLVLSTAQATKIHSAILKSIRDRPAIHDFVSYGQFAACGWQSKIELGPEQGKTISFLMNHPSASAGQLMDVHLLLNARKSPHFSKTSALVGPSDFRDRLGILPIRSIPSKELIIT